MATTDHDICQQVTEKLNRSIVDRYHNNNENSHSMTEKTQQTMDIDSSVMEETNKPSTIDLKIKIPIQRKAIVEGQVYNCYN